MSLVTAAVGGSVAVSGNVEYTPRSLALTLSVCAPQECMPVCLRAVPAGSQRCQFLLKSRRYPGDRGMDRKLWDIYTVGYYTAMRINGR